MSDLISRQAAIDAVCMEWCGVKHQDCKHPFDVEKDDCYWCDGCETALRTLPELPSAQPERKKGKWIDAVIPNDNGGLPVQVCDQCNTFFPLAYTGGGHRFCPSCGAKMEVEHD